jgi:thioredoxin
MTIVTCPNCGARNRIDETKAATLQPVCGRCHTKLALSATSGGTSGGGVSGGPVEVTDGNFERVVLQAGVPVLLDCWAPWCGPCRAVAPIMDRIALKAGGRYLVGKLNVDENPGVASRFQIASIPTLLIFREGKLVDQMVGLQPEQAIMERLTQVAAV